MLKHIRLFEEFNKNKKRLNIDNIISILKDAYDTLSVRFIWVDEKHMYFEVDGLTIDQATAGTKAIEDSGVFIDPEFDTGNSKSPVRDYLHKMGVTVEPDPGILILKIQLIPKIILN
jgi:hypothetical protein